MVKTYRLTNADFVGNKVWFIKQLRTAFEGMSLNTAKSIADEYDFDRAEARDHDIETILHKVNENELRKILAVDVKATSYQILKEAAERLLENDCLDQLHSVVELMKRGRRLS